MKLLIAVTMAISLAGTAPSRAESGDDKDSPLAALAKKSKKTSQAPVMTNQDLRTTKSRVTIPPGDGPAAAAAESGEGSADGDKAEGAPEGAPEGEAEEKTGAELRAERQKELQTSVDQQRDRISQLTAKKQAAQLELNDQTTNYPGNKRRATQMQLIENCDKEIADAEAQIADLRNQARRAGVAVR
jgi:hypothetical protein